jgi:hypothetical protein
MNFDSKLRTLVQECYNYLLDRWNLGLGVLLQTMVVLTFGLAYMRDAGSTFTIVLSLAIIAFHELFHVRFQKRGMYHPLNLTAERWSEKWLFRLIWVPMVCQMTLIATWPSLQKMIIGMIEVAVWAAWYYGWTVHIRDRDDTRFRQLHPQPALDTGTCSR